MQWIPQNYLKNIQKLYSTVFCPNTGEYAAKKKNRILSHSDRIQLHTVSVYFLNIFPYSLYKNSMNTGEYGAKTPGIHGGFV